MSLKESLRSALDTFFNVKRLEIEHSVKGSFSYEKAKECIRQFEELDALKVEVAQFFEKDVPNVIVLDDEDPEEEEEDQDSAEEEGRDVESYWENYEKRKTEDICAEVGGSKRRKTRSDINYSVEADLEEFWIEHRRDMEFFFEKTRYGQTVWDRIMHIANQTGSNTKKADVIEAFEFLMYTDLDATPVKIAGAAKKSKCYVCAQVHPCQYRMIAGNVGKNCRRVVVAIERLRNELQYGKNDADSYEQWHENIEDAFENLQYVHFKKNKKKI